MKESIAYNFMLYMYLHPKADIQPFLVPRLMK